MQPATPSPDPTQPQPQGGFSPVPPAAGAGLGTLPVSAPPARQPLVGAPDPHTPSSDPKALPQVQDPQDIQNIFDRRGALLAQAVQERGQNIAQAWNEQPTNSVKLDQGQLIDFWRFSPGARSEAEANLNFWQVHDQVLAQTGDPQQAEQQAMQQVFPYRAQLVGQGVANIDRQVEQAQAIRRIVDGTAAPVDSAVAYSLHDQNQQVMQAQNETMP